MESALAQTMGDLEIVVVDGASTDGTWAMCERFAANDGRVRAFRDEVNTGPVAGWWRCVEEARGTFATFLWSDDLLMPTFLERVISLLGDEVALSTPLRRLATLRVPERSDTRTAAPARSQAKPSFWVR